MSEPTCVPIAVVLKSEIEGRPTLRFLLRSPVLVDFLDLMKAMPDTAQSPTRGSGTIHCREVNSSNVIS